MGQFSALGQSDTDSTVLMCGGRVIRKGDVLASKYEFEEVIGTGAMGVVVAARHVALGERVAIKFLLPEVLKNPEAVARFMREARAAVRIKSEHVARVTDVGTFEDGAPFIVMEYLEGVDLSTWLRAQGHFAAFQAVEFILQACEAIAEAHVLGIVHRDLKPANLFCVKRRDGTLAIKVLDFGISKVGDGLYSEAFSRTSTAVLIGSPGYMSPEQLQSPRNVDQRTDIWSLGVLLFELLSGGSPFEGESLPELLLNITTQPQGALLDLRPELPPELDAIIATCLRKNRDERYSNVGQLALALRPFAPKRAEIYVEHVLGIIESAGLSVTPPPSSVALRLDQSGKPPAEQTKITWGQTSLQRRRASRWLVMGTLGVVATLGISVLAWTRTALSSSDERAAPFVTGAITYVPASPAAQQSAPVASTFSREVVESQATAASSASAIDAVRAVNARSKSGRGARRNMAVTTKASENPTFAAEKAAGGNSTPSTSACDPPYDLDALGRKHFKRECFLNQ